MIFIEAPQGSPEWYQARVGKITASCFADAVSTTSRASGKRKAGDMSAAAERYAADLAIERISGEPHGEPVKAWVLERGHEMETRARMLYEARTGAFITEAGICVSDDGIFGYSTDGLASDDGLIEIKAPIDSIKIMDMWRTGDTSEYDHQIQGGLWLTGRKWLDFIMFVPDLAKAGKDLYVKRIYRDETFIDKMVQQLADFDRLVNEYTAILRADTAPITTEEPMNIMKEVVTQLAQEYRAPDSAVIADAMIATAGARLASASTGGIAAEVVEGSLLNCSPSALPTLKLGVIAERLGFVVTAEFLASLGFAHSRAEKQPGKLYHEADFPRICAALLRHIAAIQAAH